LLAFSFPLQLPTCALVFPLLPLLPSFLAVFRPLPASRFLLFRLLFLASTSRVVSRSPTLGAFTPRCALPAVLLIRFGSRLTAVALLTRGFSSRVSGWVGYTGNLLNGQSVITYALFSTAIAMGGYPSPMAPHVPLGSFAYSLLLLDFFLRVCQLVGWCHTVILTSFTLLVAHHCLLGATRLCLLAASR